MHLLRPRHLALAAVTALLPLAFGGQALATGPAPLHLGRGGPSILSAADVQRLSANATQRSIVIVKNQHPDLPARGALAQERARAIDSDQEQVKSELAQLHTANVKSFHLVNAVSATISQAEASRLAANPNVQAVVPDLQRRFQPRDQPGASGAGAAVAGRATAATDPQQVCPSNPAQPLLEPEALQVMNVEFQGTGQPAAHDLVDGTGIKVAIIGDGLDPNNPDLIRNGKSVVFDFQDFSGYGNNAPTDGREAFLDAGAIASQGTQTYDLSGFVNPAHPLPPGCTIRIKGVAPGASVAALNVAGPAAAFFNSQLIQAVEWAVNVDRVDILNESFGGNPIPDTNNDPVALANQAAVAAGVTVVASTGDAGPTNTIGSPASAPGVIAAGGSTTLRVYRQTTRYGTQLVPGGWLSNNITALSSAGTTEFGPRGPDIVAPGDRGWELCSHDTAHFFGCKDIDHGANPPPIWAAGGTSLSAPLTSGTAALVIEAYQKTHHGAKPDPDLVKRIIVSTATDLGAPADHQGAGLVNSLKAVQLAESIKDSNGAAAPLGNTLLVSRPNIDSTATAGAQRSFLVDVTNQGTSRQTVTPTVVGLSPQPVSSDSGSLTLSSSSPRFVDGEGNVDSFGLHQFSVPAGVDYLNGDIAWNAASKPTAAFETLFDPLGRVAGYSLLGANHSGRGHVEVRHPTPGTWTALIFTVNNASAYSGSVQFSFSTQRFQPTGSVTPATLTLAPGHTGALRVTVTAAAQPGDEIDNLRLGTGGDTSGSIPILLRSLIPIGNQGGAFKGTLTGGANVVNAGQRISYQFNVPGGRPSLDVALQLGDPNYNLEGFLIDPRGEPLDVQSTAVISNGSLLGFGPTMQFFRRSPQAGRWTLSLLVFGPIDGKKLNEPFVGQISFARPEVTTRGLPNSPSTVLPAGRPVTATINVVNTGNVNKDFFADARLNGKTVQALLGADVNNVPLPLPISAQPNWLVPTNTDLLAVVAQGTVPIAMDISAANGDPDRLGVSLPGNFSVAALTDPEVAPGFFFALPEAIGPFPPNGVGNATVNLAAVADTNPFDSAVSASSGDVWAQSVNPVAPYSPVTVAPGQSGTITLTITPNAPKGTVVHGFIGVDTFNLASLSGDELAVLPYAYRVG